MGSMDEKYIEITFCTEEIEQFLFNGLLKLGYVPVEDELQDIADLVFDYIIKLTGAEELDEEG